MARLSLNVDQETYESAGRTFEPVPVGRYKVRIFEIKPDQVKSGDNAGKLRLKFHFQIVEGEESPDGTHQGNRRLFSDINAFEGVSKKDGSPTPPYDLIDIAKAINVPADDLSDFDTDDWLSEELYLSVTHVKKQHQVNGQWVDLVPAEFKEKVRGYRSVDSVETSTAAAATVNSKTGAKPAAGTTAGAKAKPSAKLIKL